MAIRRRPTACALILLYGFLMVAASLCAFSAVEGTPHSARHAHNVPIARHGSLCLWACSLPLPIHPPTAIAAVGWAALSFIRPEAASLLKRPLFFPNPSRAPPL